MKASHNSSTTPVLFVCIGNSCRSPMAEAVARKNAADVIQSSSAGVAPLGYVQAMAIQTLASNGYDVNVLSSKAITLEALQRAELVVDMTGRLRNFPFGDHSKLEDWEVEDPYGADQETYQRILDEIVARVNALADRLRMRRRR